MEVLGFRGLGFQQLQGTFDLGPVARLRTLSIYKIEHSTLVEAKALELEEDTVLASPLSKTATHEYSRETIVVNKQAGFRPGKSALHLIRTPSLPQKTPSKLLAALLRHIRKPCYAAKSTIFAELDSTRPARLPWSLSSPSRPGTRTLNIGIAFSVALPIPPKGVGMCSTGERHISTEADRFPRTLQKRDTLPELGKHILLGHGSAYFFAFGLATGFTASACSVVREITGTP